MSLALLPGIKLVWYGALRSSIVGVILLTKIFVITLQAMFQREIGLSWLIFSRFGTFGRSVMVESPIPLAVALVWKASFATLNSDSLVVF